MDPLHLKAFSDTHRHLPGAEQTFYTQNSLEGLHRLRRLFRHFKLPRLAPLQPKAPAKA